MLNKIQQYISRYRLLDISKRYIVALSGGADSVALLLVLRQLGYDIEAAHCNFHLRGEESNRDENFVKALCKQWDVVLHLAHFDTHAYAALHKVSIEMAARDLRYGWFESLRKDIGAAGICVAHHRDDNVETVLMNLIKGTGIHGLQGIKPRNGYILRPLLCVSRDEIEQWLDRRGQTYVTDSTNLVADVMRNKLRLQVIPLLRSLNPSVSASIQKTAEHLLGVGDLYDAAIADAKLKVMVDNRIYISALKDTVAPEHVLFSVLSTYHFSPAQCEQIATNLDASSGTVYRSATHQLLFDRGFMIIAPTDASASRAMLIPEEGTYVYSEQYKIRIRRMDITPQYVVPKTAEHVAVDADKVKFPLTLRTVKAGDRFVPFGMKGSKLVSDYLTDLKVNLFDKQHQLVLVDCNDQIVWLVNRRTDNRCCIDGCTQQVLDIS